MKVVNKFQQGGEVAPQQPANPMEEILMIAQQALQTQNCEAAMAVCQALIEMVSGAPAEQAPAEEPTFAKRGAKLVRIN